MKIMRIGVIVIAIVLMVMQTYAQERRDLVIVDAIDRDPWLYKPFIDSLESMNYRVTYKPVDLVLDQSLSRLALARYKAAFFIFGTEFLAGMGKSHVCTKVLQALDQYARLSGITIGLIFPSMRADPRMNLVGACAPIFDRLGIKTPRDGLVVQQLRDGGASLTPAQRQQHHTDAFFYLANMFLATPLESRPLMYHTTLNMPRGGIEFDAEQVERAVRAVDQPLFLLPMHHACSPTIQPTLPYGLYWFNQARNNHVFITTTSMLMFAGISENFQICPINSLLRQEMLALMHRMLWEMRLLSSTTDAQLLTKAPAMLRTIATPVEPSSFAQFGNQRVSKNSAHHARKIAWMELNVFQDPTPEELQKDQLLEQKRVEQRQQLVNYIFDSGVDGLWISLNPHMYFSPIGRLPGTERMQQFTTTLARFTRMLADAAVTRKAKTPNILVGYEITNNIYEPNMPKMYAVDMYENVYKDLPAPLHRVFWNQEVIEPLEKFVQLWGDKNVSNGVKLGGVVLDLEMYCRKKTGSFLSTMGFDAYTFNRFAQSQRLMMPSVALRDRPLVLMQKQLGQRYFNFLEQHAAMVGATMQRNFMRLIPRCQIMCYMPNVHISWFYKGLCKGLSAGKRPLHLLTFNSEFFAHEGWFKSNHIPATHASVLLLSKVRDHDDFPMIDYLLTRHQGIWLNRFSRFVEPKAKDWTSVEQPGMSEGTYSHFMDYMREK